MVSSHGVTARFENHCVRPGLADGERDLLAPGRVSRTMTRRAEHQARRLGAFALLLPTVACLACEASRVEVANDVPPLPPIERPSFDGGRAFAFLEHQVSLGPRIPGTSAHAAQLEWMLGILDALADTVTVDSFLHRARSGETLTLFNVFAQFNPEAERRLLLLAHWDTRPMSDQSRQPGADTIPVPGANDGASGVAVLLELAGRLREQPPTVGVDLLFTDGEDFGPGEMYLGAVRFADTLPEDYAPEYGLLLDMVGDSDLRFPVEGNSARMAPEVVQRVWGVAARMGYGRYFPLEVGQSLGDDHVPLNQVGIPTVDIIDFTYGGADNPYWHTPDDVPANTSPRSLEIVGDLVTQLIYMGGE